MADSTGSISTKAGPLDVATIVSKLMEVETKKTLPALVNRGKSISTLISGYGNLKGVLATYQTAIKGLTPASFSSQKAALTNASSATNATTEPFTTDINSDDSTKSLAQKLKSAAFSRNQIFSAGDSVAIKIGSGSPTFVTLTADATLAGVRDAINRSSAGVTASITTADDGDHLVLESQTGGTGNTVKIAANNSLSSLAYDQSRAVPTTMTEIQAARDSTKAASGTYTVDVLQLAQAQKITSARMAPGTTFDNGILAIKTGNGSTAIIKPATNSLAGVRDAINASDAGVLATIVSSSAGDHLVVSAKDSGATNTLRITGTGSFSALSFTPGGTITLPAVPPGQTYDSGNLRLTSGENSVDITPADTDGNGTIDLSDVMRAINTANNGVTASILNDGAQNRLVLTPTGTSPVSLSGTQSYADLKGSSMGQLVKAQDAKISIEGVVVASPSNKVKNAISGVQLNLSKVTTSTDKFTLNISNDTSGMTSAANTLVTAYNSLLKSVKDMTKQVISKKLGEASQSAPLASESSVKTLMSQLRTALTASVEGGGQTSLAQIGITFQKDGGLALDATKFSAAITNDFEGVSKLFSSKNGGVTQLQKLTEDILADKGIIATKSKGLEGSQTLNSRKQTAVNANLLVLQDSYTNRFNRLNKTLASMGQTRDYLSDQLARLSTK
ncbi:flagellar hook protein [Herbaspirillum sp. meg3]|uniref:flagellar filament capping protein FliD n=1 Tax=Herbaspirillum sp. meg3 TaxID=2025949 RepID=UPI000B9858F3|nr:flagellar filament capping protein FliD [Herbaspirillum sp. meg3]ASU38042.1 flagellar hook protein [Herbaspirillum sp. meg3]